MAIRYVPAAPTGLYGWIQSNDARSLKLFGGFALAVQLMAAGALLIPLAMFDPEHSPLFGMAGYCTRYVPAIFLASLVGFAAQLFWYMQTVKNASGFVFVDARDEPRLCRLIEPLIITLGMPAPFVAVIETGKRNAFACGISRHRAVVVVTRGLLDALTDAELDAVLAHELAHIRNGDIRLMAAANICMRNAREFRKGDTYNFNPVAAIVSIAIPALFPLILLGCFVLQTGYRWAFASRLAITSSREFIADAEAAQLTKNPAALASALLKIDGQHRIDTMRRDDDAMMIAGESAGPDASHPAVGERIAALTRVTGSLVFNAPGAAPREMLGNVEHQALLRGPAKSVLRRARAAVPGGWLGLDRRSHWIMAATVASFLLINFADLGSSRAMAAKFDVRTIGVAFGFTEQSCASSPDLAACVARNQALYQTLQEQRGTLAGYMAGQMAAPLNGRNANGVRSGGVAMEAYEGESGKLTGVEAARNGSGSFVTGAGTFSSSPPKELEIAEINAVGCFPADLMHGKPEGHYAPGAEPSGGFSLSRAVSQAEIALIPYGSPGSEARREWLFSYAEKRETLLTAAYDLYGLAGLRQVFAAFATPAHDAVIGELREGMRNPAFTVVLDEAAEAKVRALARNPARFVPCQALRHGFAA